MSTAPHTITAPSPTGEINLRPYQLADRYTATSGRVFLTGTQALVRIVLDQARRDRAAGLNTGGFVSGYRGSPLGGVDQAMWAAADLTSGLGIEFLPAVNEDLAATAVLGSQQVETTPGRDVQGVFGLWYGKGPGVDRAGDALKHGNAYGASPHGGVLVVAGDDHGCVSSSMPHQSDVAFMSWLMPVLNPASVGEYLAFGEYGYALSRYSGMWVGFKAVSETVEAAASVELAPPRTFRDPDFTPPPGGLHYRWPDLPGPGIEERMEAKKHAVFAFAEANPIDHVIHGVANPQYGIVTTGKGHLDVMEALHLLGITGDECHRLGLDIYKVGMVWPLARRAALDFVRGKSEVLVIEEKRGIIESQLKEYFYDWPGDKPARMVGKNDETLSRLIPWTGELSPRQLVPLIAERLHGVFPDEDFPARAGKIAQDGRPASVDVPGATRTPYFCSGCPHNTSTRVPAGSRALAGIGCHFMASWMDRDTSSLIQMGGEGVNWAASSRFTGRGHIFQNLGEGTWYHSGSMAIRQSVAAGANITYKILYNDAVAMTGGQPVDGPVSVAAIAHTCRAEGVQRIALVTEDTDRIAPADLPAGVSIYHRRDLDAVQRELRDVPGVSVLIYDQACATETRRRRKRGLAPDPKTFPQINQRICEGCGDCSVASNCLSVEPVETDFGRKRRINLSSCNKDLSCVDGFCPSFVTVENARRRAPDPSGTKVGPDPQHLLVDVADPVLPPLNPTHDLLVTGVGGTGVVTVGQLITMAAHLQGLGASVLDFTGFAQKFGPVLSFIRLGPDPASINQVRIDTAAADAVIGGDVIVCSSARASATYHRGTRMVVNMAAQPTGDIVMNRDADLQADQRLAAIGAAVGPENVTGLNAHAAAERLMGDAIYANIILLGHAWQSGLIPVGLAALTRAINLNGVKVAENHRAFAWGRVLAVQPDVLQAGDKNMAAMETPARLIDRRAADLTLYQNRQWAERYRQTLTRFRAALPDDLQADQAEDLLRRAARSLYKVMAYKDEYEVARLALDPAFRRQLDRQFEPGYRLRYHLAPPFLQGGTDARGRPLKRSFGPWVRHVFRLLALGRPLRGTRFDPFGYTTERRQERALIDWYERVLNDIAQHLAYSTEQAGTRAGTDFDTVLAECREQLDQPQRIRGFGPVKQAAMTQVLGDG